jgi:hypothetical protein
MGRKALALELRFARDATRASTNRCDLCKHALVAHVPGTCPSGVGVGSQQNFGRSSK